MKNTAVPMPGRRSTKVFLAAMLFSAALTLCGETVWKADFLRTVRDGGSVLPENWKLDGGKMFVPMVNFNIVPEGGAQVLDVRSDVATGAAMTMVKADLRKYPFLRWKWRTLALPPGGDGRNPGTDDQAIVIYLGAGPAYSRKSISYRWETETPPGTEGKTRYGGGLVQVFYRVLRNKNDAPGEWRTESVNVLEDFKKQYGFVPDKFVISVGANSQYTRSRTHAQLASIELSDTP